MDHWFENANSNYSVPCTHHVGWLGYAVFSYGAMRVMEEEVRADGLQQLCKRWDCTHDVGLGIFVWEHAIQDLPICCGCQAPSDDRLSLGTFFYAVAKPDSKSQSSGHIFRVNYLMHRIWELGGQRARQERAQLADLRRVGVRAGQEGLRQALPQRRLQELAVLPQGRVQRDDRQADVGGAAGRLPGQAPAAAHFVRLGRLRQGDGLPHEVAQGACGGVLFGRLLPRRRDRLGESEPRQGQQLP